MGTAVIYGEAASGLQFSSVILKNKLDNWLLCSELRLRNFSGGAPAAATYDIRAASMRLRVGRAQITPSNGILVGLMMQGADPIMEAPFIQDDTASAGSYARIVFPKPLLIAPNSSPELTLTGAGTYAAAFVGEEVRKVAPRTRIHVPHFSAWQTNPATWGTYGAQSTPSDLVNPQASVLKVTQMNGYAYNLTSAYLSGITLHLMASGQYGGNEQNQFVKDGTNWNALFPYGSWAMKTNFAMYPRSYLIAQTRDGTGGAAASAILGLSLQGYYTGTIEEVGG